MEDNGRLVGLGGAEEERLARILARVRADHGARLVFVARACGQPLAWAGDRPDADLDSLASLVASTCAAAARLGSLLGEDGVGVLLQKGERDVVQVTAVEDMVLAVVCADQPPQGLERLRARLRQRKALDELRTFAFARVGGEAGGSLPGGSPQEIDELLDGFDRPSS